MRVIALDARPPKQYAKGRSCETCGTELSVYNPGQHCAAHAPEPNWVYQGYLFALCDCCGEVVQISRKAKGAHYCKLCREGGCR